MCGYRSAGTKALRLVPFGLSPKLATNGVDDLMYLGFQRFRIEGDTRIDHNIGTGRHAGRRD